MSDRRYTNTDSGLVDYRPAVSDDEIHTRPWHWVLLLVALTLAFILGFGTGVATGAPQETPRFRLETEAELPCIDLEVRPRVMLPLTRADLQLEARVRRHADHRMLAIAWDGGLAGAGASQQALHGADEPYLFTRTIRQQPAAAWQLVAAVFDARGTMTGKDLAAITLAGAIE